MHQISVDENQSERWKDVRRLTDRASAFAHPQFEPGPSNMQAIHDASVLVVGAGGLGCEILKCLALSGFKNLEVIDMDTIDLSNLNRQFLFRQSDVGKSKAEVAAAFIEKRVSGCRVIPHNCKIQDKDVAFYRKFALIICGLDSISARRWLNNLVCSLVKFEDGQPDFSTLVPLIDGGTEGFKGNARVILPFSTPCIECTLDLYPPQVAFPMCTIAHTPRLPEHCVEYVKMILWEKESPFDGATLDADKPEHVEWAHERAAKRANQYGIQGVDARLTLGVLKRIIPAVATTNAIIAGSCVLEALKLVSNISLPMNNYLNFANNCGINFSVVSLERNPTCVVCSQTAIIISVDPEMHFEEFIKLLKTSLNVTDPSVQSSNGMLYLRKSSLAPQMEEISVQNLKKSLRELALLNDAELVIADESLPKAAVVRLKYAVNQGA